jgi:hypothetical protein
MGGAERVGRLHHDPPRLLYWQLTAAANTRRDRLAIHVSHDEIDQPLSLADAMDRNDVGVGQAGRGLCLSGEPLAYVLLEGELGRKNLDRDSPLEPFVAGTVDDAHPAPANLALDSVGGTESFGETCGKRSVAGHGNQSVPALPERQPNPLHAPVENRLSRQEKEPGTDESRVSGPIWQERSTGGTGGNLESFYMSRPTPSSGRLWSPESGMVGANSTANLRGTVISPC